MAHALVPAVAVVSSAWRRVMRAVTRPRPASWWVGPAMLALLATSAAGYVWVFASAVAGFSF